MLQVSETTAGHWRTRTEQEDMTERKKGWWTQGNLQEKRHGQFDNNFKVRRSLVTAILLPESLILKSPTCDFASVTASIVFRYSSVNQAHPIQSLNVTSTLVFSVVNSIAVSFSNKLFQYLSYYGYEMLARSCVEWHMYFPEHAKYIS